MKDNIQLNDYMIRATDVKHETISNNGTKINTVSFHFEVTHEEYHEVTTLLYTNEFFVNVPKLDLRFEAEIKNYYTSITNLYKEDTVGTFYLELIEKTS